LRNYISKFRWGVDTDRKEWGLENYVSGCGKLESANRIILEELQMRKLIKMQEKE
jgi:hypothetical protein